MWMDYYFPKNITDENVDEHVYATCEQTLEGSM